VRGDRAWSCEAGHSYDIARSGYVNLLQPQDRRSTASGDSRDIVAARAALADAGVGHELIDAVVTRARALRRDHLVVVDLGSGPGDVLGALAAGMSVTGIGIDISAPAAGHAARRFPSLIWAVANADRQLPLLAARIDLVLSINSRRNPAECHRVLTGSGRLFVAVPAPDDLVELRRFVQGEGLDIDRSEKMLTEHRPFFSLVDQVHVQARRRLDRAALLAVLGTTYRGMRFREAGRRDALDTMDVTFSSRLFVFAPTKT